MARLYSRTNATAIDDPEFGHFGLKDHGGFDLPDELSDRLRAFHHRGKPAWETEIERDDRTYGEETARRRDPQSLFTAVEKIAALGEQLARSQGGAAAASDDDVAALHRQVEALTERLAAMDGQSGGSQEPAKPAPASPSRARKAAST